MFKKLFRVYPYPYNKKIRSMPAEFRNKWIALGVCFAASLLMICLLPAAEGFLLQFIVMTLYTSASTAVIVLIIMIILSVRDSIVLYKKVDGLVRSGKGGMLESPIPDEPNYGKLYFGEEMFTDCLKLFVPYSDVLWMYKRSTTTKAYGVKVSQSFCYVIHYRDGGRKKSTEIPINDEQAAQIIKNYLFPANCDLMIGYTEENRKLYERL